MVIRWRGLATAMLLLVAFASVRAFEAPQTSQPSGQVQQPSTSGMHGAMTMDCQSLMAMHDKFREEIKTMDGRLDTLVQSMNTATGPAKVDATAAVVSELVSQRKTMREHMATMQATVMQHMMEHMQSGDAKAMADCPMMKELSAGMKH